MFVNKILFVVSLGKIYVPDISYLCGKTVRKKTETVMSDYVEILEKIK